MSQPIIQTFNPELLIAGDYSQLHNWLYGKGNSIYVSSVPPSMTEEFARYCFKYFGAISRVDFAPHKVGTGRMMFVHFSDWNDTAQLRYEIAKVYPQGLNILFPPSTQLACYVNTRPIPVVEYNIHQLADMFASLKQGLQAEVLSLREEVAELRESLEITNKWIRHFNCDLHDVMLHVKFFDDTDDEQDYDEDDIQEIPITEQQKSAVRKHIHCAERHFDA
jgi:hypothetical protein